MPVFMLRCAAARGRTCYAGRAKRARRGWEALERFAALITHKKWVLLGFVGIQLCASWLNDFLQPAGGMTYAPFICTEGVVALLLGAAASRRVRSWTAAPLRWVPVALGLAAMVVGILGGDGRPATASSPTTWAVACLGGTAVALGYARWVMLYAQTITRDALGGLLGSFIITGCFKFATPYLSLLSQALIIAPLMVVSLWCDRRIGAQHPGIELQGDADRRLSVRAYLPLLAELAVFSVTLGYLGGFMTMWQPSVLRFVLRLACSVVLFVLLYVRKRPLDLTHLIQAALVLVLLGPVAQTFAASYTDTFITTGICLIQIMLFVAVIDSASFDSRSPYTLFGCAWGIFALGLGIGRIACRLLPTAEFTMQVALLAVCGVSVVSVFALTRYRDLRLYAGTSHNPGASDSWPQGKQGNPTPPAPSPTPTASEERWEALANVQGLTRREAEVGRLIAQGYSKKRIAEVLSISENTVRMHARSIYAKLDIHTKQELIELAVPSEQPFRDNGKIGDTSA